MPARGWRAIILGTYLRCGPAGLSAAVLDNHPRERPIGVLAASALGLGRLSIEIIGEVDEFVACAAKLHLGCQVSQDFSHVPVFLRFPGRRQNLDHIDFPLSA
jgi:hypothetical protein